MKVIGFTNKFYTLWEVTEETRPLGNGRSYVVTHFEYIKNISFSKDEAMNKYPGVSIDENLRGKTRSWETTKEVWDNVDTFRFGKYMYQKINAMNDLKYTEWYWQQVAEYDNDHKEYIEEFLKSKGYEIRVNSWTSHNGSTYYNKYLMSPENLEEEKREKEEYNISLKKCENKEILEFVPEYNLDSEGEYRDGNILYIFPEIKENYYNGFSYYLPTINGKAKRIKNKKIIVKDYTWKTNQNFYIIVNVNKFEVSKI